MKNKLINGRELAKNLINKIKSDFSGISVSKESYFVIVRVGNNEASRVYVERKVQMANEIGFKAEVVLIKEGVSQAELETKIAELNSDINCKGILLQLPLPAGLDWKLSVEKISPEKDIDGLGPVNQGKLMMGQENGMIPCTAAGVLYILDTEKVDLDGKVVVVIGKSNIVGKPVIQLCLNRGATVISCNSRTKNLNELTLLGDVVVVAVGKEGLISADMVKNQAFIIDVGINRGTDGKLVGDVDFESVESIASQITPVPGGVGPLTVAFLMKNVLKAFNT